MNAEDKNGFIVAECRVSAQRSRPPRIVYGSKWTLFYFQGPPARISQDLARNFLHVDIFMHARERHNAARRPIEKESVHKLCEKKAMIKLLLFCVSHPFITSLPPLFRRSPAARALPARRDAFSARSVRAYKGAGIMKINNTRDLLATKMLFPFQKEISNKWANYDSYILRTRL